jgi:agmatine deiminase
MADCTVRRLPAEWEEQDCVLVAWPHAESDWAYCLEQVEPVFADIVREISREEVVLVVGPDPERIRKVISVSGADMGRVRIHEMPTNDTWARDFGPITVQDAGRPLLLDFGFNGWGLKFPTCHDNRITRRLQESGAFGATMIETVGLVLEGGSIESDGQGTILTTTECLLNPNRNPHLSRSELETALGALFGADRFLWLNHGYLAGDDTDSHIDTLARLCLADTILHITCDDPADEHFEALCMMRRELEMFRTRRGSPYRLLELPWPSPQYDDEGRRLPATYANYLVINRAVLVPTYRDRNDAAALKSIASAFPGRRVVGIDSLTLILQHGSLHCVTMQIPKGVLPPCAA